MRESFFLVLVVMALVSSMNLRKNETTNNEQIINDNLNFSNNNEHINHTNESYLPENLNNQPGNEDILEPIINSSPNESLIGILEKNIDENETKEMNDLNESKGVEAIENETFSVNSETDNLVKRNTLVDNNFPNDKEFDIELNSNQLTENFGINDNSTNIEEVYYQPGPESNIIKLENVDNLENIAHIPNIEVNDEIYSQSNEDFPIDENQDKIEDYKINNLKENDTFDEFTNNSNNTNNQENNTSISSNAINPIQIEDKIYSKVALDEVASENSIELIKKGNTSNNSLIYDDYSKNETVPVNINETVRISLGSPSLDEIVSLNDNASEETQSISHNNDNSLREDSSLINSPSLTTEEEVISISPVNSSNIQNLSNIPTISVDEDISIPPLNSSRIESSVVNNPTISIENPQVTVIETPVTSQLDQVAGLGLSSGANSVSVSESQANNYKVLTETLSDYEGLGSFHSQYIPTTNTAVEQVLTVDQINALSQLNNELSYNVYNLPQQHLQDILDFQASIKPIIPIIQGKCISMNWVDTNLLANDIGVGPQGDIYAAGIDGHLYFYDFVNNKWKKVIGDFDLGSITRVEVSTDGTPYVVTASGSTYFLSSSLKWKRLPGCATDIAVGRGGEVYKIGCDVRPNGYGIYRLFNNEENESLHKKHNRCKRRKGICTECSYDDNNENEVNKKYWFRLSGSGVRISASPSGLPYIVNNSGMVLSYENSNWTPILTAGLARDLALSNDGEIFYVDFYHNIFRIINRNGYVFQLCGVAKTISSGPFSQPFIVGTDHKVYTASKYFIE